MRESSRTWLTVSGFLQSWWRSVFRPEVTKPLESIWARKRILKNWYESIILPLCQKYASSSCENHGEINLVSIASTLLSGIFLPRLFNTHENTCKSYRYPIRSDFFQSLLSTVGVKKICMRSIWKRVLTQLIVQFCDATCRWRISEKFISLFLCSLKVETEFMSTAILHPSLKHEGVFVEVTVFVFFCRTL